MLLPRNTLTLPLVFHVVYFSEEENNSELQILSQIDVLNRDFQRQNENLAAIPSEFEGTIANTGLEFCLASSDPDGNPTTGITRTRTNFSNIASVFNPNGRPRIYYSAYGGQDAWDPERYINVWVGALDGILGAASFPQAGLPAEDGILIDPRAVGSIGLSSGFSPFDRGHTLTHEMGHYLNLAHVWGSMPGCESDDFVADTPFQSNPYLGCPTHPQISCSSSDMFMNFMDFTNDHCISFFTLGQSMRMLATIDQLRPGLLETETQCSIQQLGDRPIQDVFNVFYSPADQSIIVSGDERYQGPVTVSIWDLQGRLISTCVYDGSYLLIRDVLHYPPAIYVCTIEFEDDYYTTKIPVY